VLILISSNSADMASYSRSSPARPVSVTQAANQLESRWSPSPVKKTRTLKSAFRPTISHPITIALGPKSTAPLEPSRILRHRLSHLTQGSDKVDSPTLTTFTAMTRSSVVPEVGSPRAAPKVPEGVEAADLRSPASTKSRLLSFAKSRSPTSAAYGNANATTSGSSFSLPLRRRLTVSHAAASTLLPPISSDSPVPARPLLEELVARDAMDMQAHEVASDALSGAVAGTSTAMATKKDKLKKVLDWRSEVGMNQELTWLEERMRGFVEMEKETLKEISKSERV
jgi:hypothetical protein